MKKLISLILCILSLISVFGLAFVAFAEEPPPTIVFDELEEMTALFSMLGQSDSQLSKYLKDNKYAEKGLNERKDVEGFFNDIFKLRLPFVESMTFSRMSLTSSFRGDGKFDTNFINISYSPSDEPLYFFSVSTIFNSAKDFLDKNGSDLYDVSEGFPAKIKVYTSKFKNTSDKSILFFMDVDGYFVHARLYNVVSEKAALNDLKSIRFAKSFILSHKREGKSIASSFCYDNYKIKRYLGDLNADGKISSKDARLVLRASAKLISLYPEDELLADVNNDFKLSSADARLALRVSAKLEHFAKPKDSFLPIDEEGIRVFERAVVTETNKYRQKLGLQPLIENPELSRIARFKSIDMRDFNYFEHESPNFGRTFELMKSFGIRYKNAGENIGKGYKTPETVVKAWWESPSHKANMVKKEYKYIGVGYVEEGNYWTQLFTN